MKSGGTMIVEENQNPIPIQLINQMKGEKKKQLVAAKNKSLRPSRARVALLVMGARLQALRPDPPRSLARALQRRPPVRTKSLPPAPNSLRSGSIQVWMKKMNRYVYGGICCVPTNIKK